MSGKVSKTYVSASVIVDAVTRQASTYPITNKTQATDYLIHYIRKLKGKRPPWQLKEMHSDGEFIGKQYEQVCLENGIAHVTGAPYTPQSQGMVERINRTWKTPLWKTMRDTGVPDHC